MSFSTFPIHPDIDPDDPYAQETLEALRHAINNNNNDTHASTSSGPTNIDPLLSLTEDQQRAFGAATSSAQVDSAMKKLVELSEGHVQTLEKMDVVNVLSGMISGLTGMLEGMKKQGELVKGLSGHMGGNATALSSADPTLAKMFVPRAEYDELKAKYEDLLASTLDTKGDGSKRKKRKLKEASKPQSVAPEGEEGEEKAGGRKRRSFKLEHLVHQMANRRLGLEYLVTNFRVVGSTTLPDPSDPVPPLHMSANGIQEFRPDWHKDPTDEGVAAFIEAATGDAWNAWEGGVGEGEEGVDMDKIKEAVETYWVRLQKRWLEQQARERGETHKDALTRKKQNQYRRQQSLVGRRLASFDASPLNSCRLRALYRTLLTIDFASPTNERPDPTRAYTEDQWNAYRRDQLGSQANFGHEVIDLFWLSPAARSILILLDTFSTARSSALRRKGKPKAPAPLFHLPASLWDRSSARLPLLRPKDESGLPIPGTPGIILFKFHIDPSVIAEYPEWAEGLYDDPPIPESDISLQRLKEIMQYPGYSALKLKVKKEKNKMEVKELTDDEIEEILARPEEMDIPEIEEEELVVPTPPPGTAPGFTDAEGDTDFDLPTGLTAGLEPYITMSEAEARLALQAANESNFGLNIPASNTITSTSIHRENTPLSAMGAGMGTSAKSRKQGRKGMSEVPEGAARPVAKRQRIGGSATIGVGGSGLGGENDADQGIGKEIEEDLGFLD